MYIHFRGERMNNPVDLSKKNFMLLVDASNSPLWEFIDYKKLLLSDLFAQALKYASDKADQHNDYTLLERIINNQPTVDIKLFLSGYSCERFALHARSEDRKNIRLRKNKQCRPNSALLFSQSVSEFCSNRMNILKYKNGAHASLKGLNDASTNKKNHSPKSTDLLDSWLVLPGSFESGKRR
ncbi:hypothetical protein EV681_0028 [Advenella incenata]|uniref:Uncharacterized protein n=2 Tax=Advenella incenata TaxID=267800 RepID=A0A4Q7VPH3_9BURK|nr:hypothetical protein EV681_0028 [Advenella incenata]